jgi:hypothetical protein
MYTANGDKNDYFHAVFSIRLSLENVMPLTPFLRRQEPRQKTFISTLWIPAFAGMTVYYFSAKA